MSDPAVSSGTGGPRRDGITALRWSLAWAMHLLMGPGRRALATLAAWLWFDVIRYRRSLILANLAIAFPDWPLARRRKVGRRSLYHLCCTAVEAFHLPFLNAANLHRYVVFEGHEHIAHALTQGRGVLLASQHLGNVETMMAAVSLRGHALRVIAKRFRSGVVNRLVYDTRESFGTTFIDPHGDRTAFQILHACRSNAIVAFVIDQFMRKEFGVETSFFGRKTGTAYGLALFALKTKAPVLPMYSYRAADHRLHIVTGEPIPSVIVDGDRADTLRATTQRYTDFIESIVRQHPEQWMWVHRRWKPFL